MSDDQQRERDAQTGRDEAEGEARPEPDQHNPETEEDTASGGAPQ